MGSAFCVQNLQNDQSCKETLKTLTMSSLTKLDFVAGIRKNLLPECILGILTLQQTSLPTIIFLAAKSCRLNKMDNHNLDRDIAKRIRSQQNILQETVLGVQCVYTSQWIWQHLHWQSHMVHTHAPCTVSINTPDWVHVHKENPPLHSLQNVWTAENWISARWADIAQ